MPLTDTAIRNAKPEDKATSSLIAGGYIYSSTRQENIFDGIIDLLARERLIHYESIRMLS